jgi:hypothetical protein
MYSAYLFNQKITLVLLIKVTLGCNQDRILNCQS